MSDAAASRNGASRVSWRRGVKASFLRGGVVFGVANGVVLFLLLLMVDLMSPLYPRFIILGDPDIFRLAGKVWATGGLPYVDYWDHKGPLIFFANMLGYLLTGNENGVFWVDAALLLASMYFIWKLVGALLGDRPLWVRTLATWAPTLWFIGAISPYFDMTETVCLPFLAAGAWLGIRDARRLDLREGSVSWVTALVLGLGFSAGLLTRLTNALMVCVFALVLAVALALRGLWVDFGRCVLGFLGGVLVLALPFVAYFAAHGALYDMVYGTLIYNISYAEGGSNRLIYNLFTRDAVEILCVPVLLLIGSCLIMFKTRKVSVYHVALALCGLFGIILFLATFGYLPYSSVFSVLFPCVFRMFLGIRWRYVGLIILALIAIYSIAWLSSTYVHARHGRSVCTIPTVGRVALRSDSVALYGPGEAMTYLRYDIDPVYPLANLQDWQASLSEDYRDRLLDMYSKGDAEYILVQKDPRFDVVIQPVLDSRYALVEKGDDGVLVYRLVDSSSSEGDDSR